MLILSRDPSQAIKINDDVTITIISVRGNQVRLGIDAPDHISIHREEVYKLVNDSDTLDE